MLQTDRQTNPKGGDIKNLFFYKNIDVSPPFWFHILLYIQLTFILTNEIPRETTQEVLMQELWFLPLGPRQMLINKFLEDIVNGFQVIDWTFVYD